MSTVRVACLSDTHTLHRKIRVPDADLLIVAGDFCAHGKQGEARAFADWIHGLPHPHKIIVAGNHDLCLQEDMALGRRLFQEANEHYLMDREVAVLGLRIYGSPWQPAFHDWALNLPRNGKALPDGVGSHSRRPRHPRDAWTTTRDLGQECRGGMCRR